MAVILAVDTTTEHGSLALAADGRLLAESVLHSEQGFSGTLFEHLRELLDRAGVELPQVDAYAAAAGPGSFTGVRVGLAAVKALAEACAKPVVAVSNLQALAWFGSKPLRATVVDARRGDVFGAVYSAALEPVQEEVVTLLPRWLVQLPEGELELITNDAALLAPSLAGARFDGATVTVAPPALARAVAAIAGARLATGEGSDPAAIDANYIRRSDAELLWKDRG